jgi:hypothetical protein
MPANGQLTRSELAPIWNGKLLRADAARAFNAMDANNVRLRGRHIFVDDAYRPLGHPGDLSRGLWSRSGLRGSGTCTAATSPHAQGLLTTAGG